MISNRIIGSYGEKIATDYVIRLGYKILANNFKTRFGEIDIIALDNKTIVFIEVKYRKSLKFGRPSEAVNNYKQNKIRSVASFYLQKNNLINNYCRFDVLEIIDTDINYIINAF